MKTVKDLPASVIVDGKEITRKDFFYAMSMYGMYEGYSYDEFSMAMTWIGILDNKTRSDGRTEREVWIPLLEEYLN